MCLPNPIYHEVAFAGIMLFAISRICYLITRLPPIDKHPAKARVRKTIFTGMATFALGFAVWNVDNLFCPTLRSWRAKIGPFGFLLEFHAWWHILTMAGAYLILVGAICESAERG